MDDLLWNWPSQKPNGNWDYACPSTCHPWFGDIEESHFEAGAMTLHELGEVLRRAAYTKGLNPVPEYKVVGRRIDWIWKDRENKVVAAFEIEGQDVEKSRDGRSKGLKKDCESLMAIEGCRERIIILYQVSKSGRPKGFKKRFKTATACREHYHNEMKNRLEVLQGKKPLWKNVELIHDYELFDRLKTL